ncbi:MAG: hypothetical protein M5T61_20475 [Acidimicrobiia bacterium]|nr:hypothetical protein [Acidimicrobiia bacterium]
MTWTSPSCSATTPSTRKPATPRSPEAGDRNHVYAVATQEPAARPTDDLRRALAVSTAKQTAH